MTIRFDGLGLNGSSRIPLPAASSKKEGVGSGLNKALAAIEDATPDTLQDVLTPN